MYCIEHNNTTAKMRRERERRTNGRHMRQKTCRSRTSVLWSKMLKSVYKYATLTVKHRAELNFIYEPHKSCSHVSSSVALHTVSALVSLEVGAHGSLK